MKKAKLIAIAATATALFFGSNVNAQTTPSNKFRLGIGVEGGIPTGNAKSISNAELGGTARLQYGATDNLALTLTSGYYNFFGKDDPYVAGTKYQSLGVVPVKAGLKAFFTKNLYAIGELGAGFETTVPGVADGASSAGLKKDVKFIASPGLGYANKSWDVGARYENFAGQGNNYGLVALRIAYGFPL